MTQRTALFLVATCAAGAASGAAGCKSESAAPQAAPEKTAEPSAKLAGVWPKDFQCDSIATAATLAELLGGEVRQTDNPASMPKGVAPPCKYEVARAAAAAAPAPGAARPDGGADTATLVEQWQFDFDCRDNYKKTADALFAEYRQKNADAIATWNEQADAGVFKPNDAGIEYHRPGDAVEVAVGAKALDHHGQALIFLDDDAPCYVRVAGSDAARRLELAKLIARQLTFDNAPMTPRARK